MRRLVSVALPVSLLVVLPSLGALAFSSPQAIDPLPVIEVLSADRSGADLVFELPELRMDRVVAKGESFDFIEIPGGGFTGAIGEPAIPVFTRLLAVPDDAAVAVRAEPLETEEHVGVRLMPVQKGAGEEFAYNAAAYARASAGNASGVVAGEPQILRDLRVVPLTFMPVRYDPVLGTLTVTRRMRVEVEFLPGDARNVRRSQPRPIPPSFYQLYREIVINFDGPGPTEGPPVTPGTYLVICPNDAGVVSRLQPLLDWRQRMGWPTVLATTAVTGTTNTQIKSYIQTAYDTWTNPPEYVVLAGDASGTYAIPTWYETMSGYNGEGDHPYTKLAGNDILADVHLGRLSFSTYDELSRIVNKILGYEKTPYMAETSWYRRGAVVSDPASSGISVIDVGRWLKTRLIDIGFAEVDTVWASPFVSQMTTAFNKGDAIISYRGWLGMSGWSNSNTNALTNGWKMPFAVIITCDTGSFASTTSRSEGFLRAGTGTDQPRGAIGSIGTATIGTHTRYNNCIFLGTLHGLLREGQHTMGAALTRGKLELYLNYYAVDPSHAEIYAHWNSLMGDPAVDIWTAVPAALSVTHPSSLALGANSIAVTVTSGGSPVAGAQVCAWKGQESHAVGQTDAQGMVELPLTAATAGDLLLTVTQHNKQPYLATVPIAATTLYVGYSSRTIDDAAGNSDGQPNPGEPIGLQVQLQNFGAATATAVTAALATSDPYVTLVDASEYYGDIPAGATVWSFDDFDFTIASSCPHDHLIRFGMTVTSGGDQWHSIVDVVVVSADLATQATTVWGGNGNGRLDPGETAELSVNLHNFGPMQAASVTGALYSLSPYITVNDPAGSFGTIAGGGNGENTGDRFGVTASASTYPGHLATLVLVTQFSGGTTDTTAVPLTIGSRATTDPVGPDRQGYYAFDNTDAAYFEAPTYSWIEIDPNYLGDGTEVVLPDYGNYQDKSAIVSLPFTFKYYGRNYTQATICSNGWLAMGTTYLWSYRNWTIPGAGGPDAMLAVFWDDLYQVSGSSRVCQKYDAANHRWIVEWSRLRNMVGGSTEVFEAILYDPAYYPTQTGDGIIVYQYDTVVNPDGTDGYATVGIESPDQQDGVLVTFFNRYQSGAATLAAGRAIRFVPLGVGSTTGIGAGGAAARVTALDLCRPNPFNPATALSYRLAEPGPVTLRIYDAAGRLVETLVDGVVPAGEHGLRWDGRNGAGLPVASGTYFLRLEAPGFEQVRELTLLR